MENVIMRHCSLFTIHCSLLCTLFVIHCSLFTVRCSLSAAEIRFMSEPVSCDGLVLLQDVAEVSGNDVDIETIRQTVLFAAPAPGERRVLGKVDIRNLLSRLGLGGGKHSLSGAETLTVLGSSESQSETVKTPRVSEITPELINTLEKQVAEALTVYLDRCLTTDPQQPSHLPWNVSLKLSNEQAYALATGGRIDDISGGSNPLTGPQRFDIRMSRTDFRTGKPVVVSVDADVVLPQQAVVVKRSLPKGYIIGESDVELRRVESLKNDGFFIDRSAVVGMETTTSVREFSTLDSNMLKQPTLVKKGDIVTVRSMNNGIVVRVYGKALDDGVKGGNILVERIDEDAPKAGRSRRGPQEALPTFTARVADAGTVDVYAAARRVNSEQ